MKIKKILASVLLTVMVTALAGCADVELGTDVNVNSDGSTESIIRIKYDETINKFVNGSVLRSLEGSDKMEINTYKEGDNLYVEEGKFETEKLGNGDLAKLGVGSSLMKDQEFKNEYATVNLVKQGGIFKNKYIVEARLNEDYYGEISSQIDESLNKNGNNIFSNYIGRGVKEKIGSIPLSINLTLPVDVNESNGVISENKRTVSWNYTFNQLNPDTKITFAFTTINFLTVIIIGAIVVILLVIALVIRVRRKNKGNY